MKRNTVIIILLILLIGLYTIASTYSIVIDVTDNNGIKEIASEITIRDLFTDTDGEYNNLYYDVKRELNVTEEEANILMDSSSVNNALQVVLQSIVDYKANNDNNAKLTNDEIHTLVETAINNTYNISEETKTKIINKSLYYKNDVSDYLYDIDINSLEG